jgi:hypothetical protein
MRHFRTHAPENNDVNRTISLIKQRYEPVRILRPKRVTQAAGDSEPIIVTALMSQSEKAV